MTSIVVLVQHAEKEPVQGDPGLNERGRRQAEHVAAHLVASSDGRPPVSIVSSPLSRAGQTAQPLAAETGVPIRIDRRLTERMNLEDGEDADEFFASWRRGTEDRDWSAPGRRSSHETARDLLAAVDEHARPDRTVVLVTHGGATTDLLRTLLGDEALERRSPGLISGGPPSGAITLLSRSDSEAWRVDDVAATGHLAPADVAAPRPADIVVLVEGTSDAAVLQVLAGRCGVVLAEPAVQVLVTGGTGGVLRTLKSLRRPPLHLLVLCDRGEAPSVGRALAASGAPAELFVCADDIEDELIRAVGEYGILQVLAATGDRRAFRTLQHQPEHCHRPFDRQIHRFIGAGSGRKRRIDSAAAAVMPPASSGPLFELIHRIAHLREESSS